jgi:hypothetical protein
MMARTTKEDYARHYRDYQGTPAQIEKRSQRNKARRQMESEHGKAALAGKDVHHKRRIAHGGSNGKDNLGIASVAKNRGWETKKTK